MTPCCLPAFSLSLFVVLFVFPFLFVWNVRWSVLGLFTGVPLCCLFIFHLSLPYSLFTLFLYHTSPTSLLPLLPYQNHDLFCYNCSFSHFHLSSCRLRSPSDHCTHPALLLLLHLPATLSAFSSSSLPSPARTTCTAHSCHRLSLFTRHLPPLFAPAHMRCSPLNSSIFHFDDGSILRY